MKATLNGLKLKKGDTVFLYGNWNGNERETVDFYVQEYTIHSIGKKRCYLLINQDINSKQAFNCDNVLNVALTSEQAMADCAAYIPEYVTKEKEIYASRIDGAVRFYKENPSVSKKNLQFYYEGIAKMSANLSAAPKRIVINPYSSNERNYINQSTIPQSTIL